MVKKTSSKSKKSTKKVVEKAPPVESEPVVETPVVDKAVTVNDDSDNYVEEFSSLSLKLKNASALIKELTAELSKLEKRVARDRKVMLKKMKGRSKRVVDPNKPPSGFAKPGPVSDELRKFLGLGSDELIARTEVTKKITEYCKEHSLQKEEDKRTINVDTALRKLLRLKKGDELTFFNLQKYMKVHQRYSDW